MKEALTVPNLVQGALLQIPENGTFSRTHIINRLVAVARLNRFPLTQVNWRQMEESINCMKVEKKGEPGKKVQRQPTIYRRIPAGEICADCTYMRTREGVGSGCVIRGDKKDSIVLP